MPSAPVMSIAFGIAALFIAMAHGLTMFSGEQDTLVASCVVPVALFVRLYMCVLTVADQNYRLACAVEVATIVGCVFDIAMTAFGLASPTATFRGWVQLLPFPFGLAVPATGFALSAAVLLRESASLPKKLVQLLASVCLTGAGAIEGVGRTPASLLWHAGCAFCVLLVSLRFGGLSGQLAFARSVTVMSLSDVDLADAYRGESPQDDGDDLAKATLAPETQDSAI